MQQPDIGAFKAAFDRLLCTAREIPGADLELIGHYLQYRAVQRDEQLLRQGATAKDLFFVAAGILKIISTNEKGDDVIQFFIRENRFCTILYSFNTQTPASEGIMAATQGQLLVLSRQAHQELCRKLPYFRSLIESITQQALMEKIRIRNSLMGEEATVRYRKFISGQPDILQRVPLSDVASYLGITQQSLSRIRRKISN